MTLASKLATVEDQIVTLISARAATGGAPLNAAQGRGMSGQVPVSLGTPTDVQPEAVWTQATISAGRLPLTTGSLGGTFEETFLVPVVVFVEVGGTDQTAYKAARDRATALANDVEVAFTGNAIAAGSSILDAYVESIDRDSGPIGSSQGLMLVLNVRCAAYLGPG